MAAMPFASIASTPSIAVVLSIKQEKPASVRAELRSAKG